MCLMIIISQFYFNLILSNILNYEKSNEYSANMYKCYNQRVSKKSPQKGNAAKIPPAMGSDPLPLKWIEGPGE